LEQWRALEPLAHELLSMRLDDRGESLEGRESVEGAGIDDRGGVIVADTKQSIYGWRGARPELVRQVGERHALVETTLDKSWRSSTVVLDFVADVFRGLPENPVVSSIDVGPSAATAWMEDFTELEAARDLPGHVCVHLAEDDGGTAEIRPDLLRHAAKVVQALHDQMPNRTIGVLARRNGVVGYLMDELRALGLRASGEGGTSLTDTAPVNALLSFLQLADHPGDRLARYHVATTPLGEVVGLWDSDDAEAARAIASRTRIQLLTGGYGPTLAKWVDELAPCCDAREVQRLLQLVDLGHRWDERPTLRTTDFTRYVASESVEDPSSARVQVMTVHRSKGLEFDAVVLPELYASLAPTGRCVPIPERNREGLVVRVYPCIERHVRALFPEVEGPEREAQAAELRDEFSVLYVALTRARYALHLILPPEGGSAKHGAGLIREALELANAPAGGNDLLLERGDARWFERLEGEAEGPAQSNAETEAGATTETESEGRADRSVLLLRSSTASSGRNLARRSPASLEGGARVDLSAALRLDTARALRRGDVVHAWCEKIEWIEGWIGDDDELREIARKRAPGMHRDQVATLIGEFRGWLQAEPIRSALSREAYRSEPDTYVRVENEFPFVRRVADEIQEGFIDRLVLIQRGGQVVRAEILDFKTDAIEASDVAARTEHYRPQITAYHGVVQKQYGLDESAVTGKLVFLAAGVVRQVVLGG
jgi:ATP-dependent exoDNAse (exonuclease V) beta subunit